MEPHLYFANPRVGKVKRSQLPLPVVHFPPIRTRNRWFAERFERLSKSLADAFITDYPSLQTPDKVLVIQTKTGSDKFLNALAI